MAYDGIVTRAVVRELQNNILLGKIEKVYQPEADELVFHIHTKNGNRKLFASAGSAHARLHFIESNPVNPPAPLSFCMLLRKHLQGGRITAVKQKDSERIIEISLETLNELGFAVSKKLIFEIMGKHSNIVLVDLASGKIIDAIKRVSFDVNRVRQILLINTRRHRTSSRFARSPRRRSPPCRRTAKRSCRASVVFLPPLPGNWRCTQVRTEPPILNRSRRRLRQASLPPMFTRMTNSIR